MVWKEQREIPMLKLWSSVVKGKTSVLELISGNLMESEKVFWVCSQTCPQEPLKGDVLWLVFIRHHCIPRVIWSTVFIDVCYTVAYINRWLLTQVLQCICILWSAEYNVNVNIFSLMYKSFFHSDYKLLLFLSMVIAQKVLFLLQKSNINSTYMSIQTKQNFQITV